MSKVTKTVRETKVYEKVIRRKCDLCGVESKGEGWTGGIYDIWDTELRVSAKCETGIHMDGGWSVRHEVDLCPDCFVNRLVPWLRSEGAAVEPVVVDW